MPIIDLRSDTITKPTENMRRAMATAEVGDDVLGDDPTVQQLEEMAAGKMGKDAGLFVPSGTMGNLICQMVHCGRGDEVILGDQSHVFFFEQGGSSAIGGIHPRILPNLPDGTMAPEQIEAAVRPDNIHFPVSRLIILENTHNRCSGTPIPLDYLMLVRKIADHHRLKIHMDGARIFNAAVSLAVDPAQLAAPVDSVTFCLSKGLASPVGSVICADKDFIRKARRVRKVLGGGMRQAGVLAAAGIVAIKQMVDRLGEDHENARKMAEGIAGIKGLSIDPHRIRTNILHFDVDKEGLTAPKLVEMLDRKGIRMLPSGARRIRAVTHYQVTSANIDHALTVIGSLMQSCP